MPTITQDHIRSETKWITMVASKDETVPIRNRDRSWYLTIYINGTELDFIASEGRMLHFTQEEAIHRVKEFEHIVLAENKHYVHSLVDKFLLK